MPFGIAERKGANYYLESLRWVMSALRVGLLHDSRPRSFRNVFDANPDPITISRVADGRIVLVNPEFEKASGYSRDEALGRTTTELKLWPDPQQRERCAKLLMEQHELTVEGRYAGSSPAVGLPGLVQ
jgi:PAS domain-containing protein